MENKVVTSAVDYSLIGIGTLFGLTEIESVLGIIILIVQFIWFIVRIVIAIKTKDTKELKTTIQEGTEIVNSLNDKKEEKDNGRQDKE